MTASSDGAITMSTSSLSIETSSSIFLAGSLGRYVTSALDPVLGTSACETHVLKCQCRIFYSIGLDTECSIPTCLKGTCAQMLLRHFLYAAPCYSSQFD